MSDIYSRQKRSEIMSRVRGKGNKSTELRLIALFREHQIKGWRRNYPLLGKPDFAFPRERLAVFVDGCFWHGCPRHGSLPSANRGFWEKKLNRNKERDREVNRALRAKGWRVLRLWQHELAKKGEGRAIARVKRALQKTRLHPRLEQ